ncbi:MAG: hypothetical protein KGJ86_13675 [Chloroflexota bacterium]|nr:hypothetical protein [Chloroflexota bacterium]
MPTSWIFTASPCPVAGRTIFAPAKGEAAADDLEAAAEAADLAGAGALAAALGLAAAELGAAAPPPQLAKMMAPAARAMSRMGT